MRVPIKYKLVNNYLYARSGKQQEWKKVMSINSSTNLDPINQFFGENRVSFYKDLGMKGHNGIDWFAPDGTCLYASITGEIAWVSPENDNGYGKAIILIGDEDDDGKALSIIYGHLQYIFVRAGDLVKEGDLIGTCDNTGKYTTGAHLHEGVIQLEKMKGGLTQYWLRREYGYKQDNGYLGYFNHLPLIGEYKVMSSDKYEKKIVQRVDTVNGAKGQCYWVENGDWKFLDSEKNPVTRHIPLVDKILDIMNKGIAPNSYIAITEKEFAPFKDNIIV